MGVMEVAELKTVIGTLEARVEKIRDWL